MADRGALDARQDGGSSATDPTTTSTPPPTTTPPPTDTDTTTNTDTSTDTNTDTSTPPTDTTTPPPPTDTNTATDSGSNTATTGSGTSSVPPNTSASTTGTPTDSSSSVVPSTTTQTSTIIGTSPNGQVFTSVVTSTLVSTPTIGASSDRNSTSSSHTGAIVGGVVGGVAGAAILATVLFFICRARRRRDDFDGNFDPDRVTGDNRGTLPDIDLGGAEEVTPYNYTPPGMPAPQPAAPAPGAGSGPGMPDMRQYGGQVPSFLAGGFAGAGAGAAMAGAGQDRRAASPPSSYSHPTTQSYYPPSTSDHGYPDYSAYAAYANQYPAQGGPPTSSSPPSSPTNTSFGPQTGVAGVPGRDFRHPSPGPSLAATTLTDQSASSGNHMGPGGVLPSAKEREAMQYRRQVANPDSAGGGPSGGVLQHQDAGRLNATPEDEEPSEVPPRYDSIRHDE